jgi:hypothetical protein
MVIYDDAHGHGCSDLQFYDTVYHLAVSSEHWIRKSSDKEVLGFL